MGAGCRNTGEKIRRQFDGLQDFCSTTHFKVVSEGPPNIGAELTVLARPLRRSSVIAEPAAAGPRYCHRSSRRLPASPGGRSSVIQRRAPIAFFGAFFFQIFFSSNFFFFCLCCEILPNGCTIIFYESSFIVGSTRKHSVVISILLQVYLLFHSIHLSTASQVENSYPVYLSRLVPTPLPSSASDSSDSLSSLSA